MKTHKGYKIKHTEKGHEIRSYKSPNTWDLIDVTESPEDAKSLIDDMEKKKQEQSDSGSEKAPH